VDEQKEYIDNNKNTQTLTIKYINYSIKQEYNHILIKNEPKEYEKK
jgi:hypothetical protein